MPQHIRKTQPPLALHAGRRTAAPHAPHSDNAHVPNGAHHAASAAVGPPVQMQLSTESKARAQTAQQQLLQMGGHASRWARFKNFASGGRAKSTYMQIHHHLQAAQSAKNEHEYNRRLATAMRLSRKWGSSDKKRPAERGAALQQLQEMLGSGETQKFNRAHAGGFSSSNLLHPMQKLGSGANGDAFLASYQHHPNMVFKAEGDGEKEQESNPSIAQGITAENSHYASRGVAVSRVNEMLGLDVIPKTRLAVKEGEGGEADQLGYAMEKATGYAQIDDHEELLTDPDDIEHAEMTRDMPGIFEAKYREDGDNIYKKFQTPNEDKLNQESSHEHWAHHPTTQRGMLDLQAMDYITNAGADRHGGNYFVDPKSGRVQGIDNDFSFGAKKAEGFGVHAQGLPPMMHHETAGRIEAMTTDELHGMLAQQGLQQNEIDAAKQRLEAMQEHIAQLRHADRRAAPGDRRIVSSFDKETLRRVVHDDRFNSYLKRDAAGSV